MSINDNHVNRYWPRLDYAAKAAETSHTCRGQFSLFRPTNERRSITNNVFSHQFPRLRYTLRHEPCTTRKTYLQRFSTDCGQPACHNECILTVTLYSRGLPTIFFLSICNASDYRCLFTISVGYVGRITLMLVLETKIENSSEDCRELYSQAIKTS